MLDDTAETPPATGASAEPVTSTPAASHAEALGRAAALVGLATATAACGGGDSGSGGGPISGGSSGGTAPPTVLRPQTDQEAARFILHASLSASTNAIADIRQQGYEPWLDAQMRLANDQTAEQFFVAEGYDAIDSNGYFFNSGIADDMLWKQLMLGNSGVRKRAALALSEFFVVSLNPLEILWRSQAMGHYWDTLNRLAFGNFRELLEEITLNPAMGEFLNTLGNRKADPATGRVPDENFGREVMQLFSIGLYELNPDGTLKAGPDGRPIETYDNDDVSGIAKAFTGYDYDHTGVTETPEPGGGGWTISSPLKVRQRMTADPARWRWPRKDSYHETEAKSFLGVTIPAGTNATETLRITLDTLFNHPNVGPFFGKQMIQRLVTSNPSPDYVRRVAAVFDNNGSGRRGDLGAVFKAILLDEEALSPATLSSQQFGKLREPMVKLAQWGRTFGARSASGKWEIGNLADPNGRLGQAPLRSPSVFNFFRPGYVPLGSQTAAAGLVAPEMQLVNETSVASYVNFMERMIEGAGYWARDVKARYSLELPIAHDTAALLDRIDLLLTAGQLSSDTKATIRSALDATPVLQTDTDETKLRRIHAAVFMVMVSNDYSVQR